MGLYTGKRIVQLQASLALVQSPSNAAKSATPDAYGRVPFTHPALDSLDNLDYNTKSFLTSKTKLSELAHKYDMQRVVRWCPRKVSLGVPCIETIFERLALLAF